MISCPLLITQGKLLNQIFDQRSESTRNAWSLLQHTAKLKGDGGYHLRPITNMVPRIEYSWIL